MLSNFNHKELLVSNLDLGKLNNVGISGLNSYYKLEKITDFPFTHPNELPDFYE